MSMENAILELAAAIRYAADITSGGTGSIAKLLQEVTFSGGPLVAASGTIEADVTRVEQDAKAAQQKAMDKVEAERKPSAAKAEITKALEAAKAEKAAAPIEEPAAELDYEKDVKPKLLAVGKDKDVLRALLAEFGVGKELQYAKADTLPMAAVIELAAKADAILAARG